MNTIELDNATPDITGQQAREHLIGSLPVHERRRTLAGIATAVLEGGDGPPLVLLHGPGAYAAHWLSIIPALESRYRVVIPDLPGHGSSELGDQPLDGARVLLWLGELIERTCAAERPALIGELVGGAIAMRFAARYPMRVRRLVLVDTFGLTPFLPARDFGQALHEFARTPSSRTHDELWQKCAYDLPRLRGRMGALWPPFEAYNLDRARTAATQVATQALMAEFAALPMAASDLAQLATPTTLIWGRHDLATPLGVAEAASARYGWGLHVIEQANDAPAIEQPEAFVRALLDALEKEKPR